MVGEIYDPRYQMSVSDKWDPEVRRRMGAWGGVDRYGLPRNPDALMPDHELGPHVQFAADLARIRRNRRLEDDAFGAQRNALGFMESYRPGGAAAAASGIHSRMSDVLLASRTEETPDYLFRYREHKAHEAKKAARKASQLRAIGTVAGIAASFINPALGAGIMAATQAGTADADAYDQNTQEGYEQLGMPPPPESAYKPGQQAQVRPDIPPPPLSIGDGAGAGAPPPGTPPLGPQQQPPRGGGGQQQRGPQQQPPGGGGFLPPGGGGFGAPGQQGQGPGQGQGQGQRPGGPQGPQGGPPGGGGAGGPGGAGAGAGAGMAMQQAMSQEIFQEVYRSEFAFDPYWDGVVASLDQITASIAAMVA